MGKRNKNQEPCYKVRQAERHVRLYHSMMKTDAWKSLSCVARCLYIEIERRYGGPGSNNGRIHYSIRDGAAALDLCYVACGRFDGFWEAGLKPWDAAAAALVIAEAGGMLSDYSGRAFDPFLSECVASNGRIHGEMLAVIAETERSLERS